MHVLEVSDAADLLHGEEEVTSHTLGFIHDEHHVTRCRLHPVDALMRRIFAGDIALVPLDAPLLVDPGDDFVLQIQIAPVHVSVHRPATNSITNTEKKDGGAPLSRPAKAAESSLPASFETSSSRKSNESA